MAGMMDFEWSADKAKSNINKHGVSFEDAARVFFDLGRVISMMTGRTTGKSDGP